MLHLVSNTYGALNWTLQEDWKQYHSCAIACCQAPRTGVVHDLRTNLRRIISLLDVLQEIKPSKQIKKLRKEFKGTLSLLRDLRDLQIQEKSLDKQLNPSVLVDFRKSLKKKKKAEQNYVQKYLNKIDLDQQSLAIQKLSEALVSKTGTPKIERSVQIRLRTILFSRYHQFEVAARNARPDSPPSLHKARIQFKKFRYTWEKLERVFPKDRNIEETMKSVQNALGQIQDSVVQIQFLLEFLAKQKQSQLDSEYVVVFRAIEKKGDEATSRFFADLKQTLFRIHPKGRLLKTKAA